MVVVVCVVVGAGLLAILVSVGVLAKRLFGGAPAGTGEAPERMSPPYGGLPELGPVGPLGELRPDADIGDPTASSDDLLGG